MYYNYSEVQRESQRDLDCSIYLHLYTYLKMLIENFSEN